MLFRRFRKCRRGKRAGSLVKLRHCRASIWQISAFYPIKQTNFCSPTQIKMFSNSAALCFTETWLNDAIPETARYICQIFSCLERIATQNYSGKLRKKFSSSDSASVWKGLKEITNYKTPSPSTVENQQLTDNLNEFHCRFEKTPFTSPATPLSPLLQCRSVKMMCSRSSERTREGRHQAQTV